MNPAHHTCCQNCSLNHIPDTGGSRPKQKQTNKQNLSRSGYRTKPHSLGLDWSLLRQFLPQMLRWLLSWSPLSPIGQLFCAPLITPWVSWNRATLWTHDVKNAFVRGTHAFGVPNKPSVFGHQYLQCWHQLYKVSRRGKDLVLHNQVVASLDSCVPWQGNFVFPKHLVFDTYCSLSTQSH